MSRATDPQQAVVVLSRALDQAGDVLAAVRPDQLDRPTPCEDWDVAQLLAHLVAAPARFTAAMAGDDVDWSADAPPVDHGWADRFRSSADDLLHAWHRQGAEAAAQRVDWQTAEVALHTWDLATATGQSTHLDEAVAERALAFVAAGLTADNRGEAFGPEVPVHDRAPAYHRLAAFAGRRIDEAWRDGTV
ncbi:MAG: TIGR03086 family metal-binding protein [Nocardioides sp.]